MITLLEKHSNVANGVYEFIADSKTDLTNFETKVKTLLHGKMCGTHSKCFVVETGTWFYYGADGTLTEAPGGSGGGGNDEVYEITITDDDIVYIQDDYSQRNVKINLSDEVYNYIKTNTPRFLKISTETKILYFVLGDVQVDEYGRYIKYYGESGRENEPFHEFNLTDNEENPKCLHAYAGIMPIIHDEIVDDFFGSKTQITPVSMRGVYNAIQALFTYDEATKTLNITPIDGGS